MHNETITKNGSKRLMRERRIKPFRPIIDILYIVAGAFVVALSFNLFLVKFSIASGGVSGLSIILYDLFGIRTAYSQWAVNIPLFFLGVVLLGKQFGYKTFLGTTLLPLFVFLTEDVEAVTDSILLASIYGGVGIGIGLGLVFRGKGSTGGTSLLAQIIHKYFGFSMGVSVLFMDGLIVGAAGIIYGPEGAMYALIGLYMTSKTVDFMLLGFGYAKVAQIITNKYEEVREGILHDLDRGVTRIPAYGGYTEQERAMLMCVVSQQEITKLKHLVQSIDPEAFVIITSTSEVMGKGFKSY